MAGRSIYRPAFGRAFTLLDFTPPPLTGLATAFAVIAYGSAAGAPPRVIGWTMTLGGLLGLAFALGARVIAYLGALFTVVLVGNFLDHGALLCVWIGLGGALGAIAWASRFVQKDNAFDNFDRFLAVLTGALCWSVLWACGADWVVSIATTSEVALRVPGTVFAAALLGLAFSAIVGVGDVKRLIWLRRLRSGRMPGYELIGSEGVEGDEQLPALMGGWMRADSVLVLRQELARSAFRGGWRETVVARAPSNLLFLTAGVWLRLIGVCFAVLILGALGIGALLPGSISVVGGAAAAEGPPAQAP